MIYPCYPQQTFWNVDCPARRFSGRDATMAPLGLLTLASYLPDDFHLRLVDRNIAAETEQDWQWADVVFFSLMLVQKDDYRRCLNSARKHDVKIAVGGPYTSAMTDIARRETDWVCTGEVESVIESLVFDMRNDRRDRLYKGGNQTVMHDVPVPRYDLLPDINAYYIMPVQFSRGCPFSCEFCDIIEIYGRIPRTKDIAQIWAELDCIYQLGFRGGVFFVDDNFIGHRKRARELATQLADWNRNHEAPFFYFTEASINLAEDRRLLQAMGQAGFIFVFIGIETPEPGLLLATQKKQNVTGASILDKLATIRSHGIHVIAGLIVGFDDEDKDIFAKQEQFMQASGIGIALLGLLQALPNTQLERRLRAEGRLLEAQTVHLNHTVEGMNFIPRGTMTKREYLEKFSRTAGKIYRPEVFFPRMLAGILDLRMKTHHAFKWMYLKAFLKQMLWMGIRNNAVRKHYWHALIKVIKHNPNAIGAFYYDCFHYDHLHRHFQHVEQITNDYLKQPLDDDVLDKFVPTPLHITVTEVALQRQELSISP